MDAYEIGVSLILDNKLGASLEQAEQQVSRLKRALAGRTLDVHSIQVAGMRTASAGSHRRVDAASVSQAESAETQPRSPVAAVDKQTPVVKANIFPETAALWPALAPSFKPAAAEPGRPAFIHGDAGEPAGLAGAAGLTSAVTGMMSVLAAEARFFAAPQGQLQGNEDRGGIQPATIVSSAAPSAALPQLRHDDLFTAGTTALQNLPVPEAPGPAQETYRRNSHVAGYANDPVAQQSEFSWRNGQAAVWQSGEAHMHPTILSPKAPLPPPQGTWAEGTASSPADAAGGSGFGGAPPPAAQPGGFAQWHANGGDAGSPDRAGNNRESRKIEGDVFLDGALMGRWMSRYLNDQTGRASSGPTGYDGKRGQVLPGVVLL